MGFTPWPYDDTISAVNNTYDIIQQNGDIIAHHLTQGVPWREALFGLPYPTHLENEIDGRLSRTLDDKAVFLAIDSLNLLRYALVGNWGEAGQEARSGAWATRSFADPEVIAAFSNFSLDMIERFDPEYYSYCTEVSDLILNNPEVYEDFVVFAQGVYENIKAEYPDLPVMLSLSLKSPGSERSETIANQFARIADYVDIAGISIYPYAFFAEGDGASVDTLPDGWLSQIETIAPGKPVAIAETGWPAENVDVPLLDLAVESSAAMQRDYVEKMLLGAEALDAEFVIWYTAVDYDAFWNGTLGQDALSAIWKDIGLYDEDLNPRQSLNTWQQAFEITFSAEGN